MWLYVHKYKYINQYSAQINSGYNNNTGFIHEELQLHNTFFTLCSAPWIRSS